MSENEKSYLAMISPNTDIDLVAGHSRRLLDCDTTRLQRWENFRASDWNLIAVCSREGNVQIGNERIGMTAGNIYLFAPSKWPRRFSTYSWDAYWVHFPLRVPLDWHKASEHIYVFSPPPAEFRRCIRNLMELLVLAVHVPQNWHLLALNLVECIILRGNVLSRTPAPGDLRLVRAEAMLNDTSNPCDIDAVAAACGMSRSIFYEKFRAEYGMSPRVYRERGQLNAARQLLESTEMPIPEISAQCGMGDVPGFFKRFKRMFGMTPSNYREQFRRR